MRVSAAATDGSHKDDANMSEPPNNAIVSANLQDVWALKTEAGLASRPTKRAGVDPLPNGVTITKDPNGNGKGPLNTLKVVGPTILKGWDLTGYGMAVNASVPVDVVNCKLASPADPAPNRSLYWIALGQLGGAPNVRFKDCDFDFSSYPNGNTILHNAGRVSFEGSRFTNGSQDFIVRSGGAACHINRCYVGPFGINSAVGDHLEVAHWFSGDCSVTNTFVDCREGAGRIAGGVTALLFPAATSDVRLMIDRCILLGAAAINSNYTLQARTGAGHLDMGVTNTVLEMGTSKAYLGRSPGAGALNVFQHNNRDFATGELITI